METRTHAHTRPFTTRCARAKAGRFRLKFVVVYYAACETEAASRGPAGGLRDDVHHVRSRSVPNPRSSRKLICVPAAVGHFYLARLAEERSSRNPKLTGGHHSLYTIPSVASLRTLSTNRSERVYIHRTHAHARRLARYNVTVPGVSDV